MDLYDLLEIDAEADDETIRLAIARQTAAWSRRGSMAVTLERRHEAEQMVRRLGQARLVLLDQQARAAYDADLTLTLPASPSETPEAGQPLVSARDIQRRPCPICSELIAVTARKCRFCNEWLETAPAAPLVVHAPTEVSKPPTALVATANNETPPDPKPATPQVMNLLRCAEMSGFGYEQVVRRSEFEFGKQDLNALNVVEYSLLLMSFGGKP